MSKTIKGSEEENVQFFDFSHLNLGSYNIRFKDGENMNDVLVPNRVESARCISCINGAVVKNPEDSHLEYSVIIDNYRDKNVLSVKFTIPKDDMKLGDFLSTSPYGLIKKNRTGVGATTLELRSPRNSIIVVPTKSLAHAKVKDNKNSKGNYLYYYIGSSITGLIMPNIETYLEDKDIEYKKFVVVADSLHKVVEALGDRKLEYFLMVDEIDSYQYDSSYRPALEDVIDYYFDFPNQQRCLVSATIGDFTNPLLKEEPIIELIFNTPQKRDISLLHTNNAALTTSKLIKKIRKGYPNDYILIAYNAVKRGVLPVIELLDDEEKSECGVLCSKDSESYVDDYYLELEHQQLTKKITFMTCTYFVGIDINQPFHLISVADVKVLHTLLSIDKLQQIAGRCRIPNGLLSEHIIYTSNDNVVPITNSNSIKEEVLADANKLIEYVESYSYIHKNFRTGDFPLLDIKEFAEDMKKKYYGSNWLQIVRPSTNGKLLPFYFNIDGLIIQNQLLEDLYANKKNLYKALEKITNIVDYQEEIEDVDDNLLVNIKVDESMRMTDEVCFDLICKRMEALENANYEDYIREADDILIKGINGKKATRGNQKLLERFKELVVYVPYDLLLTKLQELGINSSPNKYNQFVQEVKFWALDDKHPFKLSIMTSFEKGEKYTNDEIADTMNDILTIHYGKTELSTNRAIKKLKMFCKIERTTKRIGKGGKPINAYKILNYDIHTFSCTPTTTLTNATIREIFKGLNR